MTLPPAAVTTCGPPETAHLVVEDEALFAQAVRLGGVGVLLGMALRHSALDLVEAARTFQATAQAPASHVAAPDSLEALEEALQAPARPGTSWPSMPHPASSSGDVAATQTSPHGRR